MTARPHFVISCDDPGCQITLTVPGLTAAEARKAARQRGWRSAQAGKPRRGRDWCPQHRDLAPDRARKVTEGFQIMLSDPEGTIVGRLFDTREQAQEHVARAVAMMHPNRIDPRWVDPVIVKTRRIS